MHNNLFTPTKAKFCATRHGKIGLGNRIAHGVTWPTFLDGGKGQKRVTMCDNWQMLWNQELLKNVIYFMDGPLHASYLDQIFIFTNVKFLPYHNFSQLLIAILPAAGEGWGWTWKRGAGLIAVCNQIQITQCCHLAMRSPHHRMTPSVPRDPHCERLICLTVVNQLWVLAAFLTSSSTRAVARDLFRWGVKVMTSP